MGRGQFRRLIEQAMRNKGWSQGNLAVAIGFLPSGKTLDATGVRRILTGERPLDSWMLNRLIDVLDLDPAEAEAAAVEDYRTFLAVAGGKALAAVGGAAASVAVVQALGTKRNRSLYAVRDPRAA